MIKVSKIYGVALIGCGHMGAVHLENIYYKDNAHITYVCDSVLEKAELFKKKYGAEVATDNADECIKSENVDIVIISTYPKSHIELLEKCLKNKKHVIMEKPIGTSLEEGDRFLELLKEYPESRVLVGHILRHNHTYNTVAKMIKDGAIGKPILMRMVQNHHTMNWERYLELMRETSPIIDCGVHYLDVMQWFTDAKITGMSGIGMRTEEQVPEDTYNYGMITVTLSDGSVAYYEAGWANTISSDNLKEFVGPKGSIKIIYQKDRQSHQEEGDLIEYYKYPEKKYEMINVEGKRKPTDEQFDYLIKMIEEGAHANPSNSEVYECFKRALESDAYIRNNK